MNRIVTGLKLAKVDGSWGCYEWKNNTWIPGEVCDNFWSTYIGDLRYSIGDGKIRITWPFGTANGYFGVWTFIYLTDVKFSETRNESGKLTKLEYDRRTWIVEYNKSNNPKSINLYYDNDLDEIYNTVRHNNHLCCSFPARRLYCSLWRRHTAESVGQQIDSVNLCAASVHSDLQPERIINLAGREGIKNKGACPLVCISHVWIAKFTENFGIIPLIRIFTGNRQLNGNDIRQVYQQ
ncbi:MAG: hypothetical protein LBT50_03455 [Prevotellaceae bacterium]|jgi:hypothetical protein|nr:hypothetical protein [Prevotellaceae bacterium]